MGITAGEQQSGGEVRDSDGRLIVVGPGGVAIGGGGGGSDPLSDGTPGGALPSKTLWIAGANGAVLQGLVADATGRLRTVVEGTPAVSVSNFPATQPVSGTVAVSNFPGSQPVTGPLTDTQLRATPVPVSGTFFQGTQPVSAASLPLPSGAAQEHTTAASPGSARLSDGAAFYKTNTDTQLPAALVGGRLSVDGSGVTQPVSLAAVPTVTEKQDQPANATTTWTSATGANTALTNSSVTGYGTATITIQTPSTATAGAVTVEVTDDGTVWYPAAAVRVDNGLVENPVLLAGPGVAQSRMYAVSVDAMTGIRARLSTVITGTGNTIVRLGLIAGGIEPFVSNVPPRNPVTLFFDRATGITAEALATLTIQRGDAASTTGTTYAPTAGKTFRLVTAQFTGLTTSTGILAVKVFVRGLQAGTATVASPVRLHTDLHIPATTAANGTGFLPVWMNADAAGLLDVPPGGTLGVSHVSSAVTYSLTVVLTGYEL